MKWLPVFLTLTLLQAGVTRAGQAQGRGGLADSTIGLPEGKGTLKQELISIRFTVGALEIRFTPLEESILRLLAPDASKALGAVVSSQRAAIDSIAKSRGVSHPGVALVAFYSIAPNSRFDPRQLAMVLPSRRLQPIGIIPLAPGFANQSLNAREQTTGLVIYERPIPSTESFSLSYLNTLNRDWESMLPRLDAERARILGTAKRDSVRHLP